MLILIVSLCTVGLILEVLHNKLYELKYLSVSLIILSTAVFFGTRGNRGSDSEYYQFFFNQFDSGMSEYTFEPIYFIIVYLFQLISNYELFQVILVLFLTYSALKMIKIASPSIVIIGLLAFVIIENIGLQRQVLSFSFAMLSFHYIKSKRIFILLSLLAIGSHYAIVLLYIAYIFHLVSLKYKIIIIACLSVFSVSLAEIIPFFGYGSIQEKIMLYLSSNYGFLDSDEAFYQGAILRVSITALLLISLKKYNIVNSQYLSITSMYAFGTVLYLLFGSIIPTLATRGTMIFQLFVFYSLFYLAKFNRYYIIFPLFIIILKIPRLMFALEEYHDHLSIFLDYF